MSQSYLSSFGPEIFGTSLYRSIFGRDPDPSLFWRYPVVLDADQGFLPRPGEVHVPNPKAPLLDPKTAQWLGVAGLLAQAFGGGGSEIINGYLKGKQMKDGPPAQGDTSDDREVWDEKLPPREGDGPGKWIPVHGPTEDDDSGRQWPETGTPTTQTPQGDEEARILSEADHYAQVRDEEAAYPGTYPPEYLSRLDKRQRSNLSRYEELRAAGRPGDYLAQQDWEWSDRPPSTFVR